MRAGTRHYLQLVTSDQSMQCFNRSDVGFLFFSFMLPFESLVLYSLVGFLFFVQLLYNV